MLWFFYISFRWDPFLPIKITKLVSKMTLWQILVINNFATWFGTINIIKSRKKIILKKCLLFSHILNFPVYALFIFKKIFPNAHALFKITHTYFVTNKISRNICNNYNTIYPLGFPLFLVYSPIFESLHHPLFLTFYLVWDISSYFNYIKNASPFIYTSFRERALHSRCLLRSVYKLFTLYCI